MLAYVSTNWLDHILPAHMLSVLLVVHAFHFLLEIMALRILYEFHERDKSRKELIDALERAFLSKDGKLARLINEAKDATPK